MPIDEKVELESQYQDEFDNEAKKVKKGALIIKSGKRTQQESALGIMQNNQVIDKGRDNSQGSGHGADTSIISNHSN